ncbi:uncharacterized protein LOC132030196 [Lycium ferocissimum]|uniref:uncharacterized protein LOC132030196 n=1 Tax=Lycium ferocissimum TaxID=112874 RepID=UPI002816858D|nr:uncharacterized protein LOC132030196 [Lycium ferocissimum]
MAEINIILWVSKFITTKINSSYSSYLQNSLICCLHLLCITVPVVCHGYFSISLFNCSPFMFSAVTRVKLTLSLLATSSLFICLLHGVTWFLIKGRRLNFCHMNLTVTAPTLFIFERFSCHSLEVSNGWLQMDKQGICINFGMYIFSFSSSQVYVIITKVMVRRIPFVYMPTI